MIKNVKLKPFDKTCKFSDYVYRNKVDEYELVGVVGDYNISLARLRIGISKTPNGECSHAIFESFDSHGKKMSESKFRTDGCDREFMAVKNAMIGVGIEFENTAPCHFLELLNALGAYYRAENPDITKCVVLSQRCH